MLLQILLLALTLVVVVQAVIVVVMNHVKTTSELADVPTHLQSTTTQQQVLMMELVVIQPMTMETHVRQVKTQYSHQYLTITK
jgi:uncharacterized membrane protein YjgN (DUF898 family)